MVTRLGIAAERGDVENNPAQRRDLIEHSVVARRAIRLLGAQCRMREEAQPPEPVVDRDNHRTALRERGTLKNR